MLFLDLIMSLTIFNASAGQQCAVGQRWDTVCKYIFSIALA